MKLTRKQLMLIEAIKWWWEEHHYGPTYRELAEMLDTSAGTMFERIYRLEKLGVITTENGKCRSIRVVEDV